MGLVSGIFNLISQLSRNLGGTDFRSIWSSGRGSVSENQFQNEQLFKFTDEYAYQQQEINLQTTLQGIEQHHNQTVAFENTKNFLLSQRESQINFLDSQIKEAQSFELSAPVLRRVGVLDRSSADFLYKGAGKFENLHPISQQNLINIDYNKQVRESFSKYSSSVYSQVNSFIEKLQLQKSLIQSRELF